MDKITVDSTVSEKLRELSTSAVLCDTNGRVVGFFSPVGSGVRFEDLQLEPPTSIAEIQERRKDRSGKPLEEILSRLGVK